MLKVGLIGHGGMGGVHRSVYELLASNRKNVKLISICDIDRAKLGRQSVEINIDSAQSPLDLSEYTLYTDYKTMLEKEELDAVDICLPSFLHCEVSCYALNKGLHVFCEKPMALTAADCQRMIAARDSSGKQLMIGQCLRFWDEYVFLKKCIDQKLLGEPVCGYFFRGGPTPMWSWENWLLTSSRSGGCLMDQHIHDVDIINYIFGTPKKVFSTGRRFFENSDIDCVSTNYIYENCVINAQDDWCLNGENAPFGMLFRVSFEHGSVIYEGGQLKICPCGQIKIPTPPTGGNAYYNELEYFYNCLENNSAPDICTPESCAQTIRLALAELQSCHSGKITDVII